MASMSLPLLTHKYPLQMRVREEIWRAGVREKANIPDPLFPIP